MYWKMKLLVTFFIGCIINIIGSFGVIVSDYSGWFGTGSFIIAMIGFILTLSLPILIVSDVLFPEKKVFEPEEMLINNENIWS